MEHAVPPHPAVDQPRPRGGRAARRPGLGGGRAEGPAHRLSEERHPAGRQDPPVAGGALRPAGRRGRMGRVRLRPAAAGGAECRQRRFRRHRRHAAHLRPGGPGRSGLCRGPAGRRGRAGSAGADGVAGAEPGGCEGAARRRGQGLLRPQLPGRGAAAGGARLAGHHSLSISPRPTPAPPSPAAASTPGRSGTPISPSPSWRRGHGC